MNSSSIGAPRASLLALLFTLMGCGAEPTTAVGGGTADQSTGLSVRMRPEVLVMLTHKGSTELDVMIRKRQEKIRALEGAARVPHLERMGSLLIAKARRSYDPGFYNLAEQCALYIEELEPGSASALLMRGHVRHSLHDFAVAEEIARELVAKRGGLLDHGLLGDVLVDRGDLKGALESYQSMLNLRPCLQSYTRAAHVRLVRGDIEGARELLNHAVRAGSQRAPESLAWTLVRLARLEVQANRLPAAKQACDSALQILPDYAPALLTLGQVQWEEGKKAAALLSSRRAAELNPLPEYMWQLIEYLRETGRIVEAQALHKELGRTGAHGDPRTYALYLLANHASKPVALELASKEILARRDSITVDTHAWALFQDGQRDAAWEVAQAALQQETVFARVFYHAGAIAVGVGLGRRGAELLRRAEGMQQVLMPSERRDLHKLLAAI